MWKMFLAMATMAMAAPGLAVSTAAVPMRFTGAQEVWWAGGHYWDRRREVKLKEIAKGPKVYDLVFMGGTIVQNWEGWCETPDIEKAACLYSEGKLAYPNGPGRAVWNELKRSCKLLNIAMAGDTTQHTLWRLQNGELEGYVTKGIVLMPDMANEEPPDDVAAGIKAILEQIAEYQPQAVTLLMPILPCGERKDAPCRMRTDRINALIKEFADGSRVVWFDINDKFLRPDGRARHDLLPDFRHPLGKGYGIWRDALMPYVKDICGKTKKKGNTK